MSGVAPRPRPRWNDATATTGTQVELARRRAIAASRGAPRNVWADTGATVPTALAAQSCECPVAPPPPVICIPDYTDTSGDGVLLTVYENNVFFYDPIIDLTPTVSEPLRPFNTCVYAGFPFISGPTPQSVTGGLLVPGAYYDPAFILRYCFTVVPLAPMNNIRIGFGADDGVALRVAGATTPLAMRWSYAAGPGFGGDYLYSNEFSIGCTNTDFELVTANAPIPNNYYELGIFWIQSPGPFATQAQLNAQPKLDLGVLCRWRPTCPGPC